MTDGPPRPRLALSVGIIGHRPNRLPESGRATVAAEVDGFLDALGVAVAAAGARYQALFTPEPPLLAIVSPLAEGADRIAAVAALDKGFALDAPLPFARDIYLTDCATEASRAEFGKLLGKARSVLELPGERAAEDRAYEAVGLTVLGQSDILLVVWDGGPSAGRGGTTDMIQKAIRAGVPIVHVDANGQAPTKILWQGLVDVPLPVEAIEDVRSVDIAELPEVVDALLRPPKEPTEHDGLTRYLAESRNQRWMRPEFPWLQAVVGVRPSVRTNWNPPEPNPNALSSEIGEAAVAVAPAERIRFLAAGYGWADALGVYYAQTFRGAFVMNFLLAAMAVVFASLSLLLPPKPLFVLLEIACILAVLLNTSIGYRRDWHRRWVESREVAERLRVALPLWVLGSRPSAFSPEELPWTAWYVRALVRQQGLRSGLLDAPGLIAARDILVALLEGQRKYHMANTAPRMKTLNHVLEKLGEALFWITLAVASVYLVAIATFWIVNCPFPADAYLKYVVAAVSAALPALATALYGIRVIGDFEGFVHRSKRMDVTLRKLTEATQEDQPDLMVLRARTRSAAEAMLGDVASWRLAAESRTLPSL